MGAAGRYSIKSLFSYTTAVLSSLLLGTVTSSIVLVLDGNPITTAPLPIFDAVISGLRVRSLLTPACVSLCQDIELAEGQTIGLGYRTNTSLNIIINYDAVFTIHRIS